MDQDHRVSRREQTLLAQIESRLRVGAGQCGQNPAAQAQEFGLLFSETPSPAVLISQVCRRPKPLGARIESDRRGFTALRAGFGIVRGIIQPRPCGPRSAFIADRIRKGCNSMRSKSLAADAASTDQVIINIWEIVLRGRELPVDSPFVRSLAA
jgi:hypothetical protein